MRITNYFRESVRRGRLLGAVCAMLCAGALVAAMAASDQPASDAVGVIEGEDFSVTGPMSVDIVGGQTKTILRSGSDVQVKSGQARISLVEGGQISICGPAHFSVLKSGGALTVALQSGAIHAMLLHAPALTVYTAQIQAQALAIGDNPREILVGFENPGTMCIHTYRGALRVEQQLSGQSVIVPQGEDVLLVNGQIDVMNSGVGHCHCELQITKAAPVRPLGNSASGTTNAVAEPAAPAESAATAESASGQTVPTPNASPEAAEKSAAPAAKEEPIYQVDMPPLRFDANARVQPAPDPELMVMVRRVRVRPALVFRGRVEDSPEVKAAAPTAPTAASASKPTHPSPPPARSSTMQRLRAFFHRLWGSK